MVEKEELDNELFKAIKVATIGNSYAVSKGKIVIEAINNICLCDECRAKLESEETEVEE